MHWPTVAFGAVPATLAALPAGILILLGYLGGVGSGWSGAALFFTGVFWWAGMVSLWIAARSQSTIGKRTAVGLLLGLIGAGLYIVLSLMGIHQSIRIDFRSFILLVGPVWVSLMHVWRFRKLMRTDPALRPLTALSPPPSEKSTRRVGLALKVLLFVQLFTGCLFGATMLSGSAGLGGLGIMVLASPFVFGVALFAAWAFVRHRPCRAWAAGVFFMPYILSSLLQFAEKGFGEPAVTAACERIAPWLPLAAILLFPGTAGRLVPRPLRRRGAWITYLVAQGLMVILWGLMLLGILISSQGGEAGDMQAAALFVTLSVAGAAHAALSVLAGIIGLLFGYVGLFRQREERFIGLSLAHMVLSLPLLGFGILWLWLCSFVLANPG